MLTNYSENYLDRQQVIGNLLSTPLIKAVGREVIVFSDGKVHVDSGSSGWARIAYGVASVVLLPLTTIGLGLKYFSHTHNFFIKKEQETIDKERAFQVRFSEASALTGFGYLLKIGPVLMDALYNTDQFYAHSSRFDDEINGVDLSTADFENVRSLKQMLRQMVKKSYEHFRTDYQLVRKAYYHRFLYLHLVNDLIVKQKIPSLKFELKSKDGIETLSREIMEGDLSPLHRTTWVSGTMSPTLAAVINDGGLFKPGGQIRKEGGFSFCGENGKWYDAISREHLSGVLTPYTKIALDYATGSGIGQSDVAAITCVCQGEEGVEYFKKRLNEWLSSSNIWEFRDLTLSYYDPPYNAHNFHRHLKILWTLHPSLFEKELLPLFQTLIDKLKEFPVPERYQADKASLDKLRIQLIEPILGFKKTLPKYNEEDIRIIKACYPLLYGTDYPYKEDPEKTARKEYQYHIKGALKLGEEVCYLFVPWDKLQATKEYLTIKKITNVYLYSIESLQIFSKFNTYKDKKLHEKTFPPSV